MIKLLKHKINMKNIKTNTKLFKKWIVKFTEKNKMFEKSESESKYELNQNKK